MIGRVGIVVADTRAEEDEGVVLAIVVALKLGVQAGVDFQQRGGRSASSGAHRIVGDRRGRGSGDNYDERRRR